MNPIIIVILVIGVVLLGYVLYNFRRQKDFEGTGRIPPEDYD